MWRRPILLPALMGLLLCLTTGLAAGDDAAALAELIDGQIQAGLDSKGLRRVARADDAEFLRRVFLDVCGVVPSAERAAGFLDSTAGDKRSQLINELLASPRFGEYLGDVWRRRLVSPLATEEQLKPERFAEWLAERVNNNQGWDRIVGER